MYVIASISLSERVQSEPISMVSLVSIALFLPSAERVRAASSTHRKDARIILYGEMKIKKQNLNSLGRVYGKTETRQGDFMEIFALLKIQSRGPIKVIGSCLSEV